jgi:hypothetical protein
MKKFRFALLALGVAAITFAFTPSPVSKNGPTATVYAFDGSGIFIQSAPDTMTLKRNLCPGANQILCAEVWTDKTPSGEPTGTHLGTIRKPQQP